MHCTTETYRVWQLCRKPVTSISSLMTNSINNLEDRQRGGGEGERKGSITVWCVRVLVVRVATSSSITW